MRRTITLLFALTLIFAACGDDDAGTDTTAAPATTAAEAAEEHSDDGHSDEAESDEHAEEAEGTGDEHVDDEGAEEEHSDEGHGDDEAEDHGDDEAMAAMFVSEENIPEATAEPTLEYTVTMNEFSYDHSGLELTPGSTVSFILVNEGVLGHEFRLTTKHKAEEHVAAGHEDHGGEGGHHEDADIIVNVAPGETRTVVVTIPEHAEIDHVACLIPGHYEAGMFLNV